MERKFLIRRFINTLAGICAILLILAGSAWGADPPADSLKPSALPAEDPTDDDAPMEDLLNQTTGADALPEVPGKEEKLRPVRFEGELVSTLWAPIKESRHFYTSNRLDLTGWGKLSDIELTGSLRLDYQNLEGGDKTRADARELYGKYQTQPKNGRYAEFFVGKKILYWGKGDEVRPMDRVCPQDYTAFLFYDLNDRKTGRIGSFLNLNLDHNIRFEGFWSPYFETDQTPGLGDYFEPPALKKLAASGIAVHDTASKDEWATDAGLGGRLLFSLFKADLAIYAFSGKDSSPTYMIDQIGIHPLFGFPVPRSVAAEYPRITLYGADIERSFGPFVLRAEASYQPDGAFFQVDWQNHPMLLQTYPNGVVEKEQAQYVVGLDRNDLFVRNLFFNLQYFGRYLMDRDADMVDSISRTGMTGFLRYSFLDSRATASYRFTAFLEGKDQRHRVEISYKPLSWVQVSLGGIWYQGDSPNGYFSQYDDRDFIYGKLKLVF